MTALQVNFCGISLTRPPRGPDLTFGRQADLVIDSNRHLHRVLGIFRWHNNQWWIMNAGTAISITVTDRRSPSAMTLTPRSSAPVPFLECALRFSAGSSNYEFDVSLDTLADHPNLGFDDDEPDTVSETYCADQISLNTEQRQLLVGLSANRLRTGTRSAELPTNRELADSLGWTLTKFNRKLDHLCAKFARLGVRGLKGDLGALATSRRENLVRHVIDTGIITKTDLSETSGS